MYRRLRVALLALAATACVDLDRPPELTCGPGACVDAGPGPDASEPDAVSPRDGLTPADTGDAGPPPPDGADTRPPDDRSPDRPPPDGPAPDGPPDGPTTLPNGRPCGVGGECTSGVCAQGLCCNRACTGVCEACNLANTGGTCSATPGNTPCGTAVCTGGMATPTPTCDGAGTCRPPGPASSCGRYQCGASACLQSCTGNGQCATGNYCSGSACVAPFYLTTGGSYGSSDPGGAGEENHRVFDQSTATKWFVRADTTPSIYYRYAGTTQRLVLSYRVGSAADAPDRDPRGWVLEGSNDGTAWTTVDTRSNEYFGSRQLLKSYTPAATSTAYNRHRLRITGTNGSPDCQFSELQLYGY
jgi:hypothetical protein